jgi:hypothetical protein
MTADIIVGSLFGGVACWAAYFGFYDQLSSWQRGQELPASFWRRSLAVAAVGAAVGGFAMWQVVTGA